MKRGQEIRPPLRRAFADLWKELRRYDAGGWGGIQGIGESHFYGTFLAALSKRIGYGPVFHELTLKKSQLKKVKSA